MFFHPQDTRQNYQATAAQQVDQLWYRVHFFQQQNLEKAGDKRLVKVEDGLKLSTAAKKIWQEAREVRIQAYADLPSSVAVKHLRGVLKGRLLHGMGAAHVRETSLTLHPLYGIPYIPGSSIKGALRNWVLQAFFDGKEAALQENNLQGEQRDAARVFQDLFGTQEQRGLIYFGDAFADDNFTLRADVLTVHFPRYYQGSAPPEDNQDPNPVTFYNVEARHFDFMLMIWRPHRAKTGSGYTIEELLQLTVAWLNKALTEQGIGSKTSSGYGYFQSLNDITEEVLTKAKPSREAAHAAKQEKGQPESKVQGLVERIRSLGEDEQSRQLSKGEIYQEVIQQAEQGDLVPARALQLYWEKTGDLQVKSPKQRKKVQELKSILERS